MEWVALFAVGLLVGAVNAVAGGGMMFGFPVLIASGMPALVANATAKVVSVPGQITAALGFRSFARTLPKRAFLLLIPAAIGSTAGTVLLVHTPAEAFRIFVPYLILAAVALFLLEEFWQRHEDHVKAPHPPAPFWVLSILLLFGSVYAGYFGIGFGYVVLALLSVGGFRSIHEMNLVKNLIAVVVAVVSIVTLLPSGLIDWTGGTAMMVGVTIGGYLAAWLAPKLPTHVVRLIIAALGVVTAIGFFVTGA